MGRANILNTGTTSYLELIGNGKTYRVPPYQRDYAWTQQEWEDPIFSGSVRTAGRFRATDRRG